MVGKQVMPTPECTLPPLDLNQLRNASFLDVSSVLVLASATIDLVNSLHERILLELDSALSEELLIY